MMSLEPLELRDHHLAGRDQHVIVMVEKGVRQKGLGKARIRSGFVGRIAGSSDDEAMNHSAGTLDAIGRDAAAMSVAEEKADCLCELSRICGLRDASAQQEDQDACNSESW